MMKIHIFTYGTLIFREIWQQVVNGNYTSVEGTISGFVRKTVLGATYPVILSSAEESIVSGVLYLDVNVADIARLDAFEGAEYQRKKITVTLAENREEVAEVYLLNPDYAHIASEADWTPEWFQKHGMHRFVNEYKGFS